MCLVVLDGIFGDCSQFSDSVFPAPGKEAVKIEGIALDGLLCVVQSDKMIAIFVSECLHHGLSRGLK